MDKLLERLKAQNSVCVFVSPHLDDAIFSVGGFMQILKARKIRTVAINVFTQADCYKNTLSAKAYLGQVGYQNAKDLYNQRTIEDEKVWKRLGIKPTNLGFTEALWRCSGNKLRAVIGKIIPEFSALYPTYRWHISRGKIAKQDLKLIDLVAETIENEIAKYKHVTVFAPLGIGSHVDHLIVREAVKKIDKNIYLWGDYPYILSSMDSKIKKNRLTTRPDWTQKEKLMQGYISQFTAIFGKGVSQKTDEVIFKFK